MQVRILRGHMSIDVFKFGGVAVGSPEEVAANPDSHTGRFLAEVLGSLPLAAAGSSRR